MDSTRNACRDRAIVAALPIGAPLPASLANPADDSLNGASTALGLRGRSIGKPWDGTDAHGQHQHVTNLASSSWPKQVNASKERISLLVPQQAGTSSLGPHQSSTKLLASSSRKSRSLYAMSGYKSSKHNMRLHLQAIPSTQR